MVVGRRSFPFRKAYFQGRTVKLREGMTHICMLGLEILNTIHFIKNMEENKSQVCARWHFSFFPYRSRRKFTFDKGHYEEFKGMCPCHPLMKQLHPKPPNHLEIHGENIYDQLSWHKPNQNDPTQRRLMSASNAACRACKDASSTRALSTRCACSNSVL